LRLWKRLEDYCFALAEMQVYSGGRNAALGAAVTSLDTIEAGRWSRRYLVDDCTSRVRLPDSSDPAFLRREQTEEALARSADRRRVLLERLLNAATRAALERTERELEGIEKKLAELSAPAKVYAVLPHAARPIHVLPRGDVEKPGKA